MDSDENEKAMLEDFAAVFTLLDSQQKGTIDQGLLAAALGATGLLATAKAEEAAAQAADRSDPLDLTTFRACISDAVQSATIQHYERPSKVGSSGPTVPTAGTALLGVLEFVRRTALESSDFKLAHHAKEMSDSLTAREETRRLGGIAQRHDSEQQGVQEAHMMQAMEFNSAWSTNMTEFEKQAAEIEEQVKARHAEEFAAFQEQLRKTAPRSYKFSRELLQLRKSTETLAKQGKYDKAHDIKLKADQLERWERMKLENELKTHVATKELQLRQQQQLQIEALRRRIQRGREEHNEHWLLGAQRLMQSHRNMLSDLKTKQALENVRADVVVKLDLAASRSGVAKLRSKNHYQDVLPRIDTGRPASRSKALGRSVTAGY